MQILVTGGAGFVGSNLIKLLVKKNIKKIYSLDNYYSGNKKNHVISQKVKYLKGSTLTINTNKNLKNINFDLVFHLQNFQEYFKFQIY